VAERIGEYKLRDAIGVGTVGSVYRAVHGKTGDAVALKILLPSVSQDENIHQRFEREMSILQRLDHPNIVGYLDGDEHDDGQHGARLYYVMELVDSGSLKDELQIHGRLPWPQVCGYGVQISSALQHAHNHGIIHRDLKPANLFMTEAGNLKLGDFGIARDTHAADLTDAGLTVGTYAYMSPEQIRADLQVTDKTDLYALGCLLFEMLTGRHPFEGTNFAEIFEQHLRRDPPCVRELVPECPPELEKIIIRLMAKEPDDRPFNARYVQGYLQDVLDKYSEEDKSAAETAARRSDTIYRASNMPIAPANEGAEPEEMPQVSWLALAGVFALIAAIIAVAWFAGQPAQ
jgi:serine/threonine protein kinase